MLLVIAGALVAACGAGSQEPREPSPVPTSPSLEPVTVAAIEDHLNTVLRWGWGGRGPVACEGPQRVVSGTPLSCREPGTDLPPSTFPFAVAVLDDAGRYTVSAGDALIAVRGDYPPGTTDCLVLAAPPATAAPASLRSGPTAVDAAGPRRPENGLPYAALLHHWMSLDQPAVMDADQDGIPCEQDYPAEVIERVLASPLSPRRTLGSATMQDVRRHAEAVLSGTLYPLQLEDRDDRPGACGSNQPAARGESLFCYGTPDHDMQSFDFLLVALDTSGRYSITYYYGGAMVADYPPGSGCDDFAEPLADWTDEAPQPTYADVLASWYALGQPDSWDEDGDGLPCQDGYGSAAVDRVTASELQP